MIQNCILTFCLSPERCAKFTMSAPNWLNAWTNSVKLWTFSSSFSLSSTYKMQHKMVNVLSVHMKRRLWGSNSIVEQTPTAARTQFAVLAGVLTVSAMGVRSLVNSLIFNSDFLSNNNKVFIKTLVKIHTNKIQECKVWNIIKNNYVLINYLLLKTTLYWP